MPDGTMKLESSTLPVRVKAGGLWRSIDTTLVSGPDGLLVPTASAASVAFSGGGSDLLAKVQTSTGKWVDETWPLGALPKPVVRGASATYADVLPGVDLRLTSTAGGMSEILVVKNRAAAANPALQTLQLGIEGASVSLDNARSVTAAAADGSTAVSSSPTWWDSSVKGSSADGPAGDGGAHPVEHTATGSRVSLNVGAAAQTPSVTYPVFIDPDWSVGVQAYWFTDRAYPNQSYLNGQYAGGIQSVGNGGGYLSRAFWQFGTSPINGKHILGAQFSVTELWSNTCSGRDIQAWHYGNASPGFTWNTDPGYWNSLQDTKNLSAGSTCSGAAAVGFNVAGAAGWAASSQNGTLQIGLRAANEADTLTRRHFSQGATLTITYNSPPNTPTSPVFTAPSRGCGTQAAPVYVNNKAQALTLQATVTDPDAGAPVNAAFYVVNGSTLATVGVYSAPGQAQGNLSVSVPVGTLASGSYAWRAQAGDGIDLSAGFSPYCYFVVLNTGPALPTITAVTPATNVGQPFTVQFTSNPGDHVMMFEYWWTSTAMVSPSPSLPQIAVTPADSYPPSCGSLSSAAKSVCGASATVTVAPVDLTSTLWVASYDQAGNVSLDAAGTSSAKGFQVLASSDPGVSFATGHGWITDNLSSPLPATIPDANITPGSGPTNEHDVTLAANVSAGSANVLGSPPPSTVLSFSGAPGPTTTTGPVVDTTKSFSVSAWLRPGVAYPSGTNFAALGTSTFELGFLGTGPWASSGIFYFCTTQCTYETAPVSTTAWTYVTAIYDAVNGQTRIILGGTSTTPSVASANWGTPSSASGGMVIGGGGAVNLGTSAIPWRGDIDDPTIFPGVVDSSQLWNLYNQLPPQ